MIKRCTCQHEFQDRNYGSGMRVMNPTKDKDPQKYRCTVCGNERS